MKRVLTSLVLIPAILYVMVWGPLWLLDGVVALFALICYWEYSSITAPGHAALRIAGSVAGLAVLAVPLEAGLVALTLVALLGLTLSTREPDLAKSLPRVAVLLLGVVYIFGAWRCALLLHAINPVWLVFAVVLSWVADIFAYYAGRSLGRHKLAPRISPGKSWEGSAASLIASVAFGVVYLGRFASLPPLRAGLVAACANVAGQIGDLAESAVKRGAGVKDSGILLPGHGGLLDRVDSTLFTLPVVYLFLRQPGLV